MPKTFVIDTSVLVYDPNCLTSFQDNNVVIARASLHELDRYRQNDDEEGRNARIVIRLIEALMRKAPTKIAIGMPLPEPASGMLRILGEVTSKRLGEATAIAKRLRNSGEQVVLISKDILMRANAICDGLGVEDYNTDKVRVDELYTGIATVKVSEFPKFIGNPPIAELPADIIEAGLTLYPNQCVMFTDGNNQKCAIFDGKHNVLRPLGVKLKDRTPSDVIFPRNSEQIFAYNLLNDPDIPLITLAGIPGTGKDLMALLAAYHQLEKPYQRIIIANAAHTKGDRNPGFLPGNLNEKLEPWCQLFFDNLNLIGRPGGGGIKEKDRGKISYAEELMEHRQLIMVSLGHIKGATWHNSFIIVTEAEDLTQLEMRGITTRIGSGSKMVLTGDLAQIDNDRVDIQSSGFTRLIERMKRFPLTAHVTLKKSERSPIAELVAQNL
jgi:PhoH-like ATPase